ncbi:16S rRNA (adenine(1518)-N(6)/adenine(1519)-N(6))-dimethyltransferase RsmA [Actinomycetaceae bacterium WB03_NA08]|uniref:Ribosomal RNA small subunit methyltransferase A n=1 Tax=Scrofimicrobium canadense TaxID=2652290 RepID=A0A6N7VU09_9ACTO|nr:16S rRNA (adenine(1518)-N(6)/adenine(1519)-N(6))-dimethyltransferase RsmA [Scrofimicrobium canadense]MSS85254.1 16S rRNA (adenine(1518)-N(6)/adenine(1519)-N(6))-dimethyltransferase RsmA [Scrofimicrobium canadense]
MTLLGPAAIRDIAARIGVTPTKKLGQNFLHDGGTIRKIVRESGVGSGEIVVEVGPGLGSLTLGLVEAGARVCAVEIDPVLAEELPATVQERFPEASLAVYGADALDVESWEQIAPGWPEPTRLVANLPYNVAVPILLHFLEILPSLESALVMVQSEVADRLVAPPGSRTYGIPSVKTAWYGNARKAGAIGRAVFWPTPNVDSALVHVRIGERPGDDDLRLQTFAIIDQAFAARRKMLRGVLRPLLGDKTAEILALAGVEETLRGENLSLDQYIDIAKAASAIG